MAARLLAPAKRILSLRDPTQKMSKSAADPKSRIILTDTAEEMTLKIRKAITDSTDEITWNPKTRAGVSNLLAILHACSTESRTDPPAHHSSDPQETYDEQLTCLAAEFRNMSIVDLKQKVAEAVENRIAPIRSEYHRICADEGYILSVSQRGAERARSIASRTLSEVKFRIGLEAV